MKENVIKSIHDDGKVCPSSDGYHCICCWREWYNTNTSSKCPIDNCECWNWLDDLNMTLPNWEPKDDPKIRTRGTTADQLRRNMRERRAKRFIPVYDINNLAHISVMNGEEKMDRINQITVLNTYKHPIIDRDFITIRDHYTSVKTLIMCGCEIEKIPNIILPNITKLIICNNKLSNILNFPAIFPNLEYLNISGDTNIRTFRTDGHFNSLLVFIANNGYAELTSDLRMNSLVYLDLRWTDGYDSKKIDYKLCFPSLQIFKFIDEPEGVNWRSYELTDDEKRVLIKYDNGFEYTDEGKFDVDPYSVTDLTELSIDNTTGEVNTDISTMMKLVSRGFFPKIREINIENITDDELNEINELSFQHITKLSFEGGIIYELDTYIFDALEELTVKNVQLSNFPMLSILSDLKTITINNTKLTLTDESESITPPIVNGVMKHIKLDLRNNNIRSMKPFEKYREYFDLNLEGNPINT